MRLANRSLGGAAAAVADAAAVAGAAAVAAAGEAAPAVAAAVVAAGDGAVAAGRHTAFKSRGRLKSPGQHYGGWLGLNCASVPTERGTTIICSNPWCESTAEPGTIKVSKHLSGASAV
jgi:hypothetical protein